MKATKEVTQALVNLRVNHDFEVFLEWLRESRKTARDECEQHLDRDKLMRAQGKAGCLKVILDTNDTAAEQLPKFKS